MERVSIVDLHDAEHHFSAGHFTIFSATDREDLHGHNYTVQAALSVLIGLNGLSFDYRFYKAKLLKLCESLDRRFLLPSKSQFLRLEDQGTMLLAHFGDERIPFLKRDIYILPLTNITIEELSFWFLQQLTEDKSQLKDHRIQNISIKVSNGPGQSGSASLNFE